MSEYEIEREHYRIRYPAPARPWFVGAGDGLEREVTDLSEQGLCYRAAEGEQREIGDGIEGLLRLRRGEAIRIAGSVVRVVDRDVAVRLHAGVPLRVVLEEQRFLREHHRDPAS